MDETEETHAREACNLPKTQDNAQQSESLRLLLDQLDRPLDDVDWRRTTTAGKASERPASLLKRLRRERQHRRELKRARRAAEAAFGVKPRLSARKRASVMLSAGAVGLAAFSGPANSTGSQYEPAAANSTGEQAAIRLPAALLKASDAFKQALIEEEGVRYIVYRDVAGYPTVGIGHLVRPEDKLSVGDRISEADALGYLEQDLAEAESGVRRLVGSLPLFQHEFDALLDLVYNVGSGNVSERESPSLNAAIAARDYAAIADELDYTRAGGSIAKGLQYRSERRAAIFKSARYADPRSG